MINACLWGFFSLEDVCVCYTAVVDFPASDDLKTFTCPGFDTLIQMSVTLLLSEPLE